MNYIHWKVTAPKPQLSAVEILIGIFGSLSGRTIILLFDNPVLYVWLHQRDSCISEPHVF